VRVQREEGQSEAGECVMSQDIREWAAENGHQISDRGRIPAAIKAAYEADHPEPDVDDEEPMLIVPSAPPTETPEPPQDPGPPPVRAEERKPQPPPRDRLAALKRKPAKPAGKPHPRVSVENVLSTGWGMLAFGLARNPNAVPIGRVMAIQSETVGVMGDQAVKGTVIDRILQPIARAGERGEVVAAVLGPPAIVGLVTAKPELYPICEPVLKMLLSSFAYHSIDAHKKIESRLAKMDEAAGGVNVDEWMSVIFAEFDFPVKHSPDEDAAVRRAQGD